MKKLLFLGSLTICMIIMASANMALAQEDESTTVHITIKEDGKVTTDTTFELKEGQDPETVKKMVRHLAGDDDEMMEKEVIIMRKGDNECDHNALAWVYVDSDDDDLWHAEAGKMGLNLDSIKEAHGGAKVMVFKDEDGNVTVKELGDDDDDLMHLEHKGHGDHEILIMESGKDGEKVNIKKIKKGGGHLMIISEDDDVEWIDDEGENVDVYVVKKGDGEVKVVKKKIRVEVEDESETDLEKEIEVEVKTEKKKKEKK